MNKIYKTVWNALRHCLVVVNETTKSLGGQSSGSGRQQGSICAQTPARHGIQSKKCFLCLKALVIGIISAFSSLAFSANDELIVESGKYDVGDIVDKTYIEFQKEVSFVTIDSINCPDGYLVFEGGINEGYSGKEPYYTDFGVGFSAPTFEINGPVNVSRIFAYGLGTINGDVTVNGTVTREQMENSYKTPTNKSMVPEGVLLSRTSYDLGGIVINGNVKASVIQVANHIPHKLDQDLLDQGKGVGSLVINGDVETDWILVDTSTPVSSDFDQITEYLEINGTTHVKEDYMGSGQAKFGKLIVDGTLHNAFGNEFIVKPGYPFYDKDDIIHGEMPYDYVSLTADELDAKTIINGSNLFVGKLTNDREQVYTQTYGTIRVTDNWFRDSVINMSGGYIDEASLGPDKNLGINNVYNITGGTLIVGDLNFDSTVNLSQDGKIQTDIESIFINPDGDPEALNYVGLNASAPESVKASLTKWFTNYVAGTLRTDLEDHVNFNGGSIVVSGFGTITQTQYDDLMKAFKEAFLNSIRKDLFQA